MSLIAMVFGVLLSALGGGLYAYSELPPERRWTALIPAFFGIALFLCGVIARNDKARKHAMHFAALIGLVGLVGSIVMVILNYKKGFNPLSGGGQLAMAALCGIFLAMCVNSFIAARRARKAAEGK